MLERTIHKFKNFEEAEIWDINYYLCLTPDERIQIARELQRRFYGSDSVDVRAYHRNIK
ncbi:hypothetical protein HQ585_06275 [candidate division KSB1 bacterium]|nr:hypothetical protein [candidate division KSB1 bacterium]